MKVVATSPRVQLDRGRRAAPQVYEWLRQQIVSLAYQPGTTLMRTELMAHFGLSQTPIRDALLRLAAEGLVDIFPQHTTIVSKIDVPQAVQTQFLRRSVELEVVLTLASAANKSFLSVLETIVARQQAWADRHDFNSFTGNDQWFHEELCRAAGVPDLWTLIQNRSGHINRLRRLDLPRPGKVEAIIASHRAIVAAIAASDGDAARRYVREHLSDTMSRIDGIKAAYPHFIRDCEQACHLETHCLQKSLERQKTIAQI